MAKPGIDFPGLGTGLVIRRSDGKVLMCQRLRAPEAGSWSIVGGKVDMLEPAIDSARREAEEETGLVIGHADFLCLIEGILPEEKQHWISLIYVTVDFTGEVTLREPEKHAELRWVDIDCPPQPLSFFAGQAFERLRSK